MNFLENVVTAKYVDKILPDCLTQTNVLPDGWAKTGLRAANIAIKLILNMAIVSLILAPLAFIGFASLMIALSVLLVVSAISLAFLIRQQCAAPPVARLSPE